MDMTADAIKEITQAAVAAAQPLRVAVPNGDKKTAYFAVGGKLEQIATLGPEPVASIIGIDSLMALAADTEICRDPCLWITPDGIELVYDRKEDFGRASCVLNTTSAWNALLDTRKAVLKQKALLHLLRVELADVVLQPADIAVKLERVKFSVASSEEGTHVGLNVSLGRSIEMTVSGADKLPDEMSVTLPVYRQLGLENQPHARLRFGIEVDYEAKGFRLHPIGDCFTVAMDESLAWIHTQVESLATRPGGEFVPVLCGSPKRFDKAD